MNFNGEIKIKGNLWGGLVRSAVFHGHANWIIFSFVYIGSTTGDGLQPIAYLLCFSIYCSMSSMQLLNSTKRTMDSNHITIDDSSHA